MSKAVSVNQALQGIFALATKVDWDEVDGDVFQRSVVEDVERAGREFTLFIKHGARLNPGGLTVITQPFDPAKFIGEEWSLIAEERDPRSAALSEVDFAKVTFETCLKEEESVIKGEEKFARLKVGGRIRLGATVFMGLWADYRARGAESVLERLYKEQGITHVDFFGDVLLDPGGHQRILCLFRSFRGVWNWGFRWLERDWDDVRRSALLA